VAGKRYAAFHKSAPTVGAWNELIDWLTGAGGGLAAEGRGIEITGLAASGASTDWPLRIVIDGRLADEIDFGRLAASKGIAKVSIRLRAGQSVSFFYRPHGEPEHPKLTVQYTEGEI